MEKIITNDKPDYFRGVKKELLSQFGEPIRIIIADLVKRLKEELGEIEHIEEKQEIINDIEKIDELLKNPNLSEEEIPSGV